MYAGIGACTFVSANSRMMCVCVAMSVVQMTDNCVQTLVESIVHNNLRNVGIVGRA